MFRKNLFGILISLSALSAIRITSKPGMIRLDSHHGVSEPTVLHYWHVFCDKEGIRYSVVSFTTMMHCVNYGAVETSYLIIMENQFDFLGHIVKAHYDLFVVTVQY